MEYETRTGKRLDIQGFVGWIHSTVGDYPAVSAYIGGPSGKVVAERRGIDTHDEAHEWIKAMRDNLAQRN